MEEKRLIMSEEEAIRYSIIRETLEGSLKVEEAASQLQLSERHVYRIMRKVKEKGLEGIIHGNRNRKPKVSIEENIMKRVGNLYLKKYSGFNVTHFTEKLNEVEGIKISRESVRKYLLKERLIERRKRYPKHRKRRQRMPKEGMMVQFDTSEHDWLQNGSEIALIGGIDDSTSEVPFSLLTERNTTLSNMEVLKEIIQRKGLPLCFYVDEASHFKTQRHESVHVNLKGEYKETQIKRALRELGVNLIFASSPQAKGRIERLFGTFQDRFQSELRLRKINTIDEANKFLHEEFLDDYNRRFRKPPLLVENAWRPFPLSVDLRRVFCIKEERTVRADNTISYKAREFQLQPTRERISFVRAKVEVQEWIDESIHVFYEGKELSVKEIIKDEEMREKLIKKDSLESFLQEMNLIRL